MAAKRTPIVGFGTRGSRVRSARTLLLALPLLLLVTALSPGAQANAPQELVFSPGGWGQQDRIVEQQSDYPYSTDSHLVTNPLAGCAWSVNDNWGARASGRLSPGGSTSTAMCMVSDANPVYKTLRGTTAWWSSARGRFGVAVSAPSAGLSVTVCYSPQNHCFELTPSYLPKDREYGWSLCAQAVYSPDDPALVEISGSASGTGGGGFGVVTTITTTIKNTSARRIDKISAGVSVVSASGLGTDVGSGCVSNPPVWERESAFRWYTATS